VGVSGVGPFIDGGSITGYTFKDLFGGFVPHEWGGVFVPDINPRSDIGC